MDKQERLEEFISNVKWLKMNLDSDEIYIFAEKTLMAAEFFLEKWFEWEDMDEKCKESPLTHLYVNHVLSTRRLKEIQKSFGMDEAQEWFYDE